VDRCHRFDFQRPTVEQIAVVLRRTAEAEAIDIPPEAVAALARAATGSFRDALGTLEQIVTYCGPTIALEDVLAVLGATDSELLEETIDAVDSCDARAALLAVAKCADSGRDAGAFASDLEMRARELLVVGTLGELPSELSLTAESDARLVAQSERVAGGTVVRLLEELGSALEAVKAGGEPRTQLELALVKAAKPEVDGSLKALLSRIERLEGKGGRQDGGGPPEAAPAYAARPRAPASTRPAPDPPPAPAAERPPAPAPVEEAPVVEEAPSANDVEEAPSAAAAEEAPPAEPVAAPGPPPEDVEAFAALWPAVVELVGADNKLLSAVITGARPVAVKDGEVTVAFPAGASFMKKKAEDPAHRTTVTEALRKLAGVGSLRIAYELREDLPAPAEGDTGGAPPTEEEWVARLTEELDAKDLDAGVGDAGGLDAEGFDTEALVHTGEAIGESEQE